MKKDTYRASANGLGVAVISKVVFRVSVTKDGDDTWEGVGVLSVGVSERKGHFSWDDDIWRKVDGYLRVKEDA